ncbi:MAG: hypothetical protein N3A69_15325 [Leptospiraceae bacterium]|nr:hypothetical protein [Leptospiraceae bacterium]
MQDSLFPKAEIIQTCLKKYGLPFALEEEIQEFLDGQKSENILICCHSDCTVCNQVICDCLQEIREKLNNLS